MSAEVAPGDWNKPLQFAEGLNVALVQTAQVAEWLGWSPDKVTERQADLTRITEAASTSIRRMCGRAFEPVTEARTFSPTMLRWEVLVGDVSAVTAVEVRSAPQNAYTALEQRRL